jgi:transposase-like protein
MSVPLRGGGLRSSGAAPTHGAIGGIFGVHGQALTERNPSVALFQLAVFELLDTFLTGDGVDLMVMQELIEAQATERIGAAEYERSASRVTERNGVREPLLTTQPGDVELSVTKLREGSFFPIFERRRCIDQRLYAVAMEAYLDGVSTRSVDDLPPGWRCPGARDRLRSPSAEHRRSCPA